MGSLWDHVVNFVQPLDLSGRRGAIAPLREIGVAPQRYLPNASLESIGMQNESLRSQLEDVEHGFEHLDQVKGLFHGLLSPMSELLAEFEATKTRLQETKTKLAFLEDAHEALGARHAASLEERDLVREARSALLRENREMGQRGLRVDAALGETQLQLRETGAAKDKLARLLDIETRLSAAQADEISRLKEELSSKDQNSANLEHSLKVASDQGALLSQETATMRETLQGLSSSLDAAGRRIAEYELRVADAESLVDQGSHRIAALEQALSEEQAAHATLRAKHLEFVERSRAEMSKFSNTVHAVRARVEVTNKILDQTRGQLREKIEDLRAAERRLLESGIQIDSLEKSVRSQKDDLAAANERIAGTERMRGALIDQVNGLTETVRAKDAALQSATRTIEQLTARTEEITNGRQRAREELERRTAALQDEIARTRAERQLADGALEASRAERQHARRAAPPVAEAQREAAALAAEPGEMAAAQQQRKVAKLPRAASL